MRVFVGYGYNARDAWIERDVFPLLKAMNIDIVHGKDMHGEVLQDGVKDRIHQANAMIGFMTLRQGQGRAAFNSHIWVRDEMSHALALGKPAVEVRETDVKSPPGLSGDRQRIDFSQKDRLGCVSQLIQVVAGWSMRRLLLVPTDQRQGRRLLQALVNGTLRVRYRARVDGADRPAKEGRIDRVDSGLYLDAVGLPPKSLVEVEGSTTADGVLFSTGWRSADVVRLDF